MLKILRDQHSLMQRTLNKRHATHECVCICLEVEECLFFVAVGVDWIVASIKLGNILAGKNMADSVHDFLSKEIMSWQMIKLQWYLQFHRKSDTTTKFAGIL